MIVGNKYGSRAKPKGKMRIFPPVVLLIGLNICICASAKNEFSYSPE